MARKPRLGVGDSVIVFWRDARGGVVAGWRPWDSLGGKPAKAVAHGIIKGDHPNHITVVPHQVRVDDEKAGDGELDIPRDWIFKIIVTLTAAKMEEEFDVFE